MVVCVKQNMNQDSLPYPPSPKRTKALERQAALGFGIPILWIATQFWQRSRRLVLGLLAMLLLTGCVDYDVGIRFDTPNRGAIVQHIQLGDRLRGLSGETAQQWLETLEQRGRQLGGRVERLPEQDIILTIPFSNAADLETKFNQFFSPSNAQPLVRTTSLDALPEIQSHLTVRRNNLLLLERNSLRYDLDLRSLGVSSASGQVVLSPTRLFDLEFRLDTPWGARSGNAPESLRPTRTENGTQLVWSLVPGELNHLEAVFWLPSPLGIGALVIGLLVLGGSYLKYPRSPNAVPAETEPLS